MKLNTADLRQNYITEGLDESTIHKNPINLFEIWFNYAVEKKVLEPNAMTLATANCSGIPSARIVLLKDYSERGFAFFTNYKSIKGEQLEQNPNAALVFWWGPLARQIRITRPDYWGGYRVVPNMIEFWQGRENRLHDRLRFTKNDSGNWELKRLSP